MSLTNLQAYKAQQECRRWISGQDTDALEIFYQEAKTELEKRLARAKEMINNGQD